METRGCNFLPNLLTALLWNWEALALLIQADFDAGPRSRPEETVTHIVATTGSVFGMNVLLGKGIEVHDTSHYGGTDLHTAAMHRSLSILRLLLPQKKTLKLIILAKNFGGDATLDVAKSASSRHSDDADFSVLLWQKSRR